MPFDLSIPGFMAEQRLRIVESVARRVPRNGVIVQVGAYLGRVTACLASSSQAKYVYGIDRWNPEDYDYHPTDELGNKPPRTECTRDNFVHHTQSYPQIIPVQGNSPDDFADWNFKYHTPDMIFVDVDHHQYLENLNFWWERLRTPGILMGSNLYSNYGQYGHHLIRFCERYDRPMNAFRGVWWVTK